MRTTAIAIAVTTAVLVQGCATSPARAVSKTAAQVLISDEQEKQLGQELHQQLQKEGMRLVTDPVITSYIDQLARPILQSANKDRPKVPWRLYVVDDPKQVNAFATPGGNLYFYTGLILASQNEAQLGGVIAHEAGHVTGRHAARNLVQALGLQTVLSIALGQSPSQSRQIAAALLASGSMLAHSRSQEHEADEYGARYARRSGLDPTGLIGFFRILQQQGDTPGFLAWFSTHPATSDRISHLQQYIKENKLGGGSTATLNQLQTVQQQIRSGVR
jgi:beta-barrel assembly-enhancing protease